jgi:hypothetical protein
MNKTQKVFKFIFTIFLYAFAVIGFIFTGVFIAMQLHLTDVKGSIDSRNEYFNKVRDEITRVTTAQDIKYDWTTTSDWDVLKNALIKDKEPILEASRASGVPARMIAAVVVPEQFRFFSSNRESFKRYFEPLKILGNGTKFSFGVAGIKTGTAIQIEQNLKDKNSVYYIGANHENDLDFTTPDPDTERMDRLTDTHDHYYSYLYSGLFINQISTQWKNAGYSIDGRPEVISTLFNLGFARSVPKANPEVGGAEIVINGRSYTFGGIAYEFYYSNELVDIFPRDVQ